MNSLETYRQKPTKLTPDSTGEEIFIALPEKAKQIMLCIICGCQISNEDNEYFGKLQLSDEQKNKIATYFDNQRSLADFND